MKLKEKWSNLNGRQKQVAVIGSVAGVAALTFIVSGFNDYRSGVLARKKPNTETQIITSASRDLTMERLAGELQSMSQEWQNEKRNKAAGGQGGGIGRQRHALRGWGQYQATSALRAWVVCASSYQFRSHEHPTA